MRRVYSAPGHGVLPPFVHLATSGGNESVPACDGLRSFAFFSSAWYCASAALPSEPPWEVAPPPIIVVVCEATQR